MARLLIGFITGAGLSKVVGSPTAVAAVLLVTGLLLQVIFARRLHAYLRGADPSAIGVRSLRQLAGLIPVPVEIRALDFLAKLSLWGVLGALLVAVGWLRMT